VAKILVADDNSNIQKMVGLALKDQGIDVVAVGNGEAAVRKISDIRPDLVLADVFMPVRNGYEVCQYVKQDPSLAHIPVILLVGAFDPLDEQEAQRVGADGVLKKPFVPPDPLISMVKSALARAGVSLAGTADEKLAEATSKKTAEMLAAASAQASVASLAHSAKESLPEVEGEPLVEETSTRPGMVKFGSGDQPLAFGNLLETPMVQEEDDPAFMPPVHSGLSTERDWRSADVDEEAEEEEEETPKASWRRDAGDEALEDNAAVSGARDWRETASGKKPAETAQEEALWPPIVTKRQISEADETEDQTSAVVAETKIGTPGVPFTGDAAETSARQEPASAGPFVVPSISVVDAPADEPEKTAQPSAWFSVARSPWEAEAQKANQLAAAWDAPAIVAPVVHKESKPLAETATVEAHETIHAPVAAEEEPHTDPAGSGLHATLPEVASVGALPSATVEAIREEAASVLESKPEEGQVTPSAQEPAKSAQADMDALVAKVLAKMSPEMLQAVTREILKPVVEAMVRDEINAKKP
jgi:CheY-like chemotaxis protein